MKSNASEDLTWFHAWGEAALGLHSPGLVPEAPYAKRQDDTPHIQKRDPVYRAQIARAERISLCLLALPFGTRTMLRYAFTPFGAARAPWPLQSACDGLIGLVLVIDPTREAFQRAHKTDVEPTSVMLIRWLENRRPVPGLQQARAIRDACVAEYAAVAEVLSAEKERARAAYLQTELDALHTRLWGKAS